MERLSSRMMPCVAEDLPKLLEEFESKMERGEYQQTIACPGCGRALNLLQDADFEWEFEYGLDTIGSFLSGRPIPSYACTSCDKLFLPSEIFDELRDCFMRESAYLSEPITLEKPRWLERLAE